MLLFCSAVAIRVYDTSGHNVCLHSCIPLQNDVSEETANVVDKVLSVRSRRPKVSHNARKML